jgi:hypothetical protein
MRKAFESVGEVVEARVICEKEDPTKSRGFGFVTMATPELAKAAHAAFNGQDLEGRDVRVDFDSGQRTTFTHGGGGGHDSRGGGGYASSGGGGKGYRDDQREYRQPAGTNSGYRGSGFADSRGGALSSASYDRGGFAAPSRQAAVPVQQGYDDHRGGYAARAPAPAAAYDDRPHYDQQRPAHSGYAARAPAPSSYDERPQHYERPGFAAPAAQGSGYRDDHRQPPPQATSHYDERPRYDQQAPPRSGFAPSGYKDEYRAAPQQQRYDHAPPPRGYESSAPLRYEQAPPQSDYRGGFDSARAAPPSGYQQQEYRAPPSASYQQEFRAPPPQEYRTAPRADYRYDSARASGYESASRAAAPPGGGYQQQEFRGSSAQGQGSYGGGSGGYR